MKLFILILALLPVQAAASTWRFSTPRTGEVGLTIHASAAGTNWARPKSEAVVLTLKIDGTYNQDVTLYMGETPHDYRVLLGPLPAGKHRLDYARNAKYSAAVSGKITAKFKAEILDDPELARAPVMYLRPNTVGRFSDLPLLAWYEWLDEPAGRVLQFSMIFSNEDGGTATDALMARWGRTLDIEYVYRWIPGADTYQFRNHKEVPFHGEKLGAHPLIYDATDNNNFDEKGESPLRVILWPKPFDLSEHSREELADRNPWTYRIMYEELSREGKLEKIGDPRDYLYVEAKIQAATAAASFAAGPAAQLAVSDRGQPRMRIDRDGWVRSAIQLTDRSVSQLEFRCHAPTRPKPESFCIIEAIGKVYFLDKDFRPQPSLLEWHGKAIRLAPGASQVFPVAKVFP